MERHYTDGTEPTILPHIQCSGPCDQGRIPCPTPEACEVREPDFYGREHLKETLTDALLTAGVAAVVMVLAVFVVSRWVA